MGCIYQSPSKVEFKLAGFNKSSWFATTTYQSNCPTRPINSNKYFRKGHSRINYAIKQYFHDQVKMALQASFSSVIYKISNINCLTFSCLGFHLCSLYELINFEVAQLEKIQNSPEKHSITSIHFNQL